MKLNYKLQVALQFIAFAFYPKTTLIACAVLSAVITVALCIVIALISPDSKLYHILFALLTGTVASFFVSFIIELCSNYKHNKLAWNELQDYYSIVVNYEVHKQVLMKTTPDQHKETEGGAVFLCQNISDEYNEWRQSKDIIQATWDQLPTIIPILKQTIENKKAFLSDDEILELNEIIFSYQQIWQEIKERLMGTTLMYNALNHPDKKYLRNIFPQNILDDMPKRIKKDIARNESEKAIDRLTDTIMSDKFLLSEYMKDYDISRHGLDGYDSDSCNDTFDVENDENELNYSDEEMDEETFKAIRESFYRKMEAKYKPFVSWHISQCCLAISESLEALERIIMGKPYYSFQIKWLKKTEKNPEDENGKT